MARAVIGSLRVELEAATAKLKAGFDDAAETVTGFGRRLSKVGSRATMAGARITTGLTAPLGAMGLVAGKAAVDFESSFAGVRKTVDATEPELQALSDGFRSLAQELPISVNEINRIGEAAGQLGIETTNIVGFSETMAQLGISTNMAAEEAATALARLANITQMPQEEFGRLGASIVDLGNNFATTESEIVEMALRIAGAGAQIGMSEADILAIGAALSSVGIQAEAGGTAISRVMIEMQQAVATGGDELAVFASVAGMSVEEFSARFRDDAAGALTEFIIGLSGVMESGEDVHGILEDLNFDTIRVRDALLRSAGASDLMARAVETSSRAWKENSALTDEVGKRLKTTQSQWAILKNSLMDVAIVIGNAMLPVFQQLMHIVQRFLPVVESVAGWFADLPVPIRTTIVVVGGLVTALGPIVLAFGAVVAAIGAVIPLVTATGIAITGLIAGALTAIVVSVMSAASAWDDWKRILPIVKETYEGIKAWMLDRFTAVVDGIKAKVESVTGFFSDMFHAVVGGSFVPDMVDGIASHFGRLGEVMVGPAQAATDALTGLFNSFTNGITDKFSAAFGTSGIIPALFSGGMSALSGLAMQGMSALGGVIGSGLKKIGGFFRGLFGGPSAKELAGREIVENFQHNISSMLDETQRIKAGGELWREVNIGVVDSYIEMGLSEQQALDDLGALYAAIEAGPDRVNPALQRIQDRMAGLDQSILNTSGSLDALTRPRQIDIGFNLPDMSGFSVPGFAGGTGGEYGQFSQSGTLAMLHGDEAITPRAAVPALARDIAAAMGGGGMGGDIYIAVSDGGAQRLSRSQFRQFERAAQGGLVRIPASAIGDQG